MLSSVFGGAGNSQVSQVSKVRPDTVQAVLHHSPFEKTFNYVDQAFFTWRCSGERAEKVVAISGSQ